MLIKALFEHEREVKFKQVIEDTAQCYSKFWAVWQEGEPAFSVFYDVGFAILSNNEYIERMWEAFKKAKTIPLESLRLYVRYSESIQEDLTKTKEIMEYLHEAKDFSHDGSLLAHATHGEGVV